MTLAPFKIEYRSAEKENGEALIIERNGASVHTHSHSINMSEWDLLTKKSIYGEM